MATSRPRRIHAALLAAALAPALLVAAGGQDWPSHHGDIAGQRHSALKQITAANVATLKKAWTFDTQVSPLQTTPIVAAGVMYLTAGRNVFAVEPESGRQVWKYTAAAPVSRRGVAYWPGDGTVAPRLFTGAGDHLIAIDAKSGQLAASFGDGGGVDLKASVRGDVDGGFSLASPPAIFKNMVITGGNNGEQSPSLGLYGDIRAWDARTGKLLWSFHTVPRAGEPGVDTWEGDSWKNRSGTNTWAFFTIDEQRGLLFAPIGAPTSDYYGGDRKGKNLYGNSIVALDINSGTLKWYQQLVHHDLWDYDVPAAPALFDVKRGGRTIPAVGVITKMSTLFIFDRVTGEPIYGMEERPVPQSDVPGEASWPTQPFPLKPAPLGRTTFDPAKDFNTLTPEVEAFCKDLWTKNHFYTKGVFTPAGVDGYMVTFPSTIGGGNWNGLTYDPALGYVITNVMDLGQVGRMVKGQDRSGQQTWVRSTPWGGAVGRFWNPQDKIPCSAPPFGELVAVNVNTGDIAWKVPLGFIEELKGAGFPTTGAPNLGGGISTAGGVIFIGATNDAHFRAFDTKTGKLLWDTELDASAHGLPITYQGNDGRQYVAVAAGGGSYLGSPAGSKLVAFALPAPNGQ
jgi:glucose dehydrogenase